MNAGNPAPSYIGRVPVGLQRALFAGQWLPIVGSGISATAMTEDNQRPRQWGVLATALADDASQVTSGNPIDTISAYADLYGRAALVERLSELLYVDALEPSVVHLAFALLPFDVVVTTNVDYLL